MPHDLEISCCTIDMWSYRFRFLKPVNTGDLLNYRSECPNRYKNVVLTTLLHMANKISSYPKTFLVEIETRFRKLFINNTNPITTINQRIKKFLKIKLQIERSMVMNRESKLTFYEKQTNEHL